jgi:hypothetical protein
MTTTTTATGIAPTIVRAIVVSTASRTTSGKPAATTSAATVTPKSRVGATKPRVAGETVEIRLPAWRPPQRPMSLNRLDAAYDEPMSAAPVAVLWSSGK